MGGEGIENMLTNMVLKKKHTHTHKSKKTCFHASLFENGLNIFRAEIWQDEILPIGLIHWLK